MKRVTWAAVLSVVVAALALQAACGNNATRSSPGDCASASPVVDAALLAFLSKARLVHREADSAEEKNDYNKAIASLEKLTKGATPNTSQPSPEVREVLADTWARLAQLRTKNGQLNEAINDAESGLKLVPESNYFRGHLLEVLGAVELKRADAAEKAGNQQEASRAKARALEVSAEALKIQEQVISRSLENKPGGNK